MHDRFESAKAFLRARWRFGLAVIAFCLGSLPSFPDAIKQTLSLKSDPAWIFVPVSLILTNLWLVGLLILIYALFEEYHHQRMRAMNAEGAQTALRGPSLDPQHERLLQVIRDEQIAVGSYKLVIRRDGAVTPTGHNVAIMAIGVRDDQEFERLMNTMPQEYLRHIPELRWDSPFVVSITPAGTAYLDLRAPQR
jgi:hypothetical protein